MGPLSLYYELIIFRVNLVNFYITLLSINWGGTHPWRQLLWLPGYLIKWMNRNIFTKTASHRSLQYFTKRENVFSEIISPHCIRALLLYTGWPSPMNKELRQLKLPIKFAIQFLTSFLNNHWTNKHNCSVNTLKNSWNWDCPQRTKGPYNSKVALNLYLISIFSLVCVYIWFK